MKRKIIALIFTIAMLVGCMVGYASDVVADIPEERILRLALEDFIGPGALDPVLSSGAFAQKLIGPVFESLLTLNLDGIPVPYLAKSWESNEDYTVWTIHLEEGVRFHDGWGEMTAEDVKFSMERFMGPGSLISTMTDYTPYVEEVVVLDRYKLAIHLNEPIPLFMEYYMKDGGLQAAGMVMCKAYWDKAGEEGFMKHPIGTGQWKFVEYLPGDSIIFDAVDEHWTGMVPEFDRLVMMEIPEEGARVAMLERGDADFIDVSLDTSKALKKMDYNIVVVKNTGLAGFRMWDTWRPEAIEANMPLTHREVRQALSLAINRQEIVDTMFGGLFDPLPFPGPMTPRDAVGIDKERWTEWAKEGNKYDPERAKELLVGAGFPDGFEITALSYVASRGPWQRELWEVIAGYWEKIGVTTNIQNVDFNAYHRPMFRTLPHPDELICTISLHTSALDIFPAMSTPIRYEPNSTFAFLDIYNEEWMELINQVASETDPALQGKYHDELLGIIGDQYVNPNLFYVSTIYVVSDKVGDYSTINGMEFPTMWVKYFKPAK